MRKASGDSRPGRASLALWHVAILAILFGVWYALTTPGLVDEAYANKIAFFFGRPLQVVKVVIAWFTSGKIYPHLAITLWETLLAFAIGSVLGLGVGLWLGPVPPPPRRPARPRPRRPPRAGPPRRPALCRRLWGGGGVLVAAWG